MFTHSSRPRVHRIVLFVVALLLVSGASQLTFAQTTQIPPGNPFQALLALINALQGQVNTLQNQVQTVRQITAGSTFSLTANGSASNVYHAYPAFLVNTGGPDAASQNSFPAFAPPSTPGNPPTTETISMNVNPNSTLLQGDTFPATVSVSVTGGSLAGSIWVTGGPTFNIVGQEVFFPHQGASDQPLLYTFSITGGTSGNGEFVHGTLTYAPFRNALFFHGFVTSTSTNAVEGYYRHRSATGVFLVSN